MTVLRATVLIDAPPRTVAGLLRDTAVAAAAWGGAGHRLTAAVRLLAPGDEVRIAVRLGPGLRVPVRTEVVTVSDAGMSVEAVSGPLRGLVHSVTLTPAPAGTLDELSRASPPGPFGRVADVVLLRRLVPRMLAVRREVLVARAAALAAGPVVVATAILRDGRLLVAQRTRPPTLAGRWELPGGRMEAGESEPEAVVRECLEELGAAVRVTGRLGTDLPLDAGVLRVHTAELVAGSTEPRALEHAGLRWVGPDEVPGVDWVDADRAVVADLIGALDGRRTAGGPAGRGPEQVRHRPGNPASH